MDVVDLDVVEPETRQPGRLSRKNWWRQSRLIRELKGTVGRPTPKLVWMTVGIATQGRPPYQLVDATAHPEAVARGQAWVTQNPGFRPSEPGGRTYTQSTQQQPQQPFTPPAPSPLEEMANRARQTAPQQSPPLPYQPPPPPPPYQPQQSQPWQPVPQQPYPSPPEDIPF